ncbi:Sensor kinase CckA [Defluviimonas aquaemixtae]|uniref:histidine kinase n=1 Tax=Albidovulum aquaemixtae TaxID=1542388 RepID=A0A2R8BLU9_9RHOB|nr:ATP-binding protein [Defluviimonas aquaemixtae]SPH24414.1 Sensor kinase CckA [Defluviimonas aquaemixtae]
MAAASIALPMLLVLSIACVAIGFVTYELENARLERRVQNTVADDLHQIGTSLWQLDTNFLQSKLDAYIEFGHITGGIIVDKTGTVVQAGTLSEGEHTFSLTRALVHSDSSGTIEIGQMTLEVDRNQAWTIAKSWILILILIATATALFSIFLIHRLLTIVVLLPINKIVDKLSQRPKDWTEFYIDLSETFRSQELEELVGSIHDMRDNILSWQGESAHSQRRLAKAAHLARLGYATVSKKHNRLLECDERYAEMHGRGVIEMLNLSVESDIFEDASGQHRMQDLFLADGAFLRGEGIVATKRVNMRDGGIRYLKVLFFPNDATDSCFDAVDIVAEDITDYNDMKRKLAQSQKMEAVGKLTGGVAHDFNNILAIISGNLELLRDGTNKDSLIGYLNIATSAVERGARFTQRLLAFARRQNLTPTYLNVSKLINEAKDLIKTAVKPNINLIIRTEVDCWIVKVDRTQLEASILNLVINARDSMRDGGELIIEVQNTVYEEGQVADSNRHGGGEYVCVSISDSGEGMSQEVSERAVEPFFTTKAVGQGTGLGLSMAYGFAKQSGGHLTINSELGRGTSIKLYLPRERAVLEETPVPANAVPSDSLRSKHVLVLEDDEALRLTLTTQLRSLGCMVSSASDAGSAIHIAGKLPQIDLLLCDVVLSGSATGPIAAEELGCMFPGLTVVFMTGYAEESVLAGVELGKKMTLLRKPFSVENLKRALVNGMTPQS